MKKQTGDNQTANYPVGWDHAVVSAFLAEYSHYIDKFEEYSIKLSMRPCFFYNKKYHTDMRREGCFLAFRVRLFPIGYTYSRAVKEFVFQEFFTHKIGEISKMAYEYKVTKYAVKDLLLERFLKKYLNRASTLLKKGRNPILAIQESIGDLLRSIIHVSRYRNEIKDTFRGINIEGIYLLLSAILICLQVYWRMRRMGLW